MKVDANYKAKAFIANNGSNDTSLRSLRVTVEDSINNNLSAVVITPIVVIVPLTIAFIIIIIMIYVFPKEARSLKNVLKSNIPLVCALAVISPIVTFYNLILSILSFVTLKRNLDLKYYDIYQQIQDRNIGSTAFLIIVDSVCCFFCIIVIILSLLACKIRSINRSGPKQIPTKSQKDKHTHNIEFKLDSIPKESESGSADHQTTTKVSKSGKPDIHTRPEVSESGKADIHTTPEMHVSESGKADIHTAPEINVSESGKADNHTTARRIEWLVILSLMVIGPIVSIISHSPYIAIAYLDDAHHAGSIFIYYTIVLCLAYAICWITFHTFISCQSCICCEKCCGLKCHWLVIALGMCGLGTFLAVVGTTSLYFVIIPINKSISDAPNRLVGIYQSGGFLIGVFVLYKLIGFFYNSKLNNLEKAIIKCETPLNHKDSDKSWSDKTNKEKLEDFYDEIIYMFLVHSNKVNPKKGEEEKNEQNSRDTTKDDKQNGRDATKMHDRNSGDATKNNEPNGGGATKGVLDTTFSNTATKTTLTSTDATKPSYSTSTDNS